MLSHFQERAEECALRIQATKSETIRQEYLRIFEGWMNLIQAEEERLTKLARLTDNNMQTATRPGRRTRRVPLERLSFAPQRVT